jgi:hypothetical protein
LPPLASSDVTAAVAAAISAVVPGCGGVARDESMLLPNCADDLQTKDHFHGASMERRLRHSVAVNPRERAEMNALLVAVDQKDAARVRAMIEGAANPDAVVDKAHTPRMPRRGGRDWAKLDGYSALYIACFFADLTIARLLHEAGASTELRVHKSGMTVLMFIASNSAQLPARGIPAAELLFDCGAEVNAVNDRGGTPLMYAATMCNTAMAETLLARGANVHTKDTVDQGALVAAVDQGHLDTARALLEAGADADSTDQRSVTVAKIAVIKKNVPMLQLLLRYGASAATAIDLGPLDPATGDPVDRKTWVAMVITVAGGPRLVPLLADYGGISMDPRCGEAVVGATKLIDRVDGRNGATNAHIAMLRRVGCDAWCDGGDGVWGLRKHHGIDGTALLGPELVGHAIQIRVRPSHLAAPLDPLTLELGATVVLHGLTCADMNGRRGVVAGALGAENEGRYRVRIGKSDRMGKMIRPRNLRPTKDPVRAAVAGHEVDALHSVVVSGMIGKLAFSNSVYVGDAAHGVVNHFPVFAHIDPSNDVVLFCAPHGRWVIGRAAELTSDAPSAFALTTDRSASPLGHRWRVSHADGLVTDTAVTVTAHAWLAGAPPADWILRDATVVDFCKGSREHKLVFTDAARTPLWARLDHVRFLDWCLLPLRHAALLRQRAVLVALMLLNRLAANSVPTAAPLTVHVPAPPGTPVLRTCLRAALTVPLQHGMNLGAIFREYVWPHVLGAPDLKVVARAEHATQTRGAASAATARAAMASGGGGGSRKQPKKGKRKKGKKRR